ncbi:DJ-1/PfpI family protein [Ligilactobacillus sp. WILCCON 0076]|uniref:DJ-1/PfpI family protein n=1 Tax=Ligilactobacillus ubinensis TaxID=2876789 RepID=A0A9X2FK78_9LACO|nr:DJ-1 family glyoxalase III [Ligilactobacillus ubinensis]MCP0885858.1 DJ-1/PfpI family protein [Ligilactobacillus ubinensis]
MAKRFAVMIADGCEEVEALTPVDVFRRLNQDVDMVGLESTEVLGAHNIKLTCDKILDESLLDYDVVVFPGGGQGAANLRANDKLMGLMQRRAKQGAWNAAMCAAPIAFARYGLLNGANYTCYPGINEEIKDEVEAGSFQEDIVVVDETAHLITSRGPATALEYAYKIAETLGIQTKDLRKAMLYDFLAENI